MVDNLLTAVMRQHRDQHQENTRAQGVNAFRTAIRARVSDWYRNRSTRLPPLPLRERHAGAFLINIF